MNSPETKEAIATAIRKEKQEGEYLRNRFRKKLKAFEEKYDMETEDFIDKFNSGELGDREDFFEWKAVYKGLQHWKNKLKTLESAT